MTKMPGKPADNEKTVSTYCYQCVAGPDLLKVRVEDGIATEVAPNFDAAAIHPANRGSTHPERGPHFQTVNNGRGWHAGGLG